MSRITAYSAITSTKGTTALGDADVFIVDGTNGSRKIAAKDLANAVQDKLLKSCAAAPYAKNGIYRGANLGSGSTFAAASTTAQKTAINNGTFEGLFIGDYWTIDGRVYRIADFNYWYNVGDTALTTNHIVLVPDASFGNGSMNATNITTGGYVGSAMYTDSSSVLNTARTTISSKFGNYLVSHKIYLCNAVTDGKESGGAWYTSTVDLMSEIMVYGRRIRNPSNFYTTEKSQLALFKLAPQRMHDRGYNTWLRDVVSSTYFARVLGDGRANADYASTSRGVRPAFAVKGTA